MEHEGFKLEGGAEVHLQGGIRVPVEGVGEVAQVAIGGVRGGAGSVGGRLGGRAAERDVLVAAVGEGLDLAEGEDVAVVGAAAAAGG